MTTRHRSHLAQQLAVEISAPACQDRAKWWHHQEELLAAATTRAEAVAAAAPALELCRRCPFYDACEQWAQLDNYKGLAAGAEYVNGRRRKTPIGGSRKRALLPMEDS